MRRLKDGLIVSLGEILEMDQSLQCLISLPLGTLATRKDIDSDWVIEDIVE